MLLYCIVIVIFSFQKSSILEILFKPFKCFFIGGYRIVAKKVSEFIVPDLTGFQVKGFNKYIRSKFFTTKILVA